MSKLPYLCILPIFPIQKPEKVDLLYTLKTMPAFAITSGKYVFLHLCLFFSHAKPPKKYFFVTSLQCSGYVTEFRVVM